MGSKSRRKATVKELPPDIVLFNILPRLPARSVLCFKTVSKQWYSFVTNPMFTNMHLQHQNNFKLLFISTETPYKFRTIDGEAPDDGLTLTRSLPFKANSYSMSIITSFNGLVCEGIIKCPNDNEYEYEYSDLVLWNPLTGDYKTLSKTNSHNECYYIASVFLLYFISSEDDYKLLCVTKTRDVYIYSLKSDLWRKVESRENLHSVSDFILPSTCMDEKLYFLKQVNTINPHTFSVMRYDLKTEKFIEITTPILRKQFLASYRFMVLRGCLHIWKSYIDKEFCDYNIELWRMNGDDDWMLMKTYCTYSSKTTYSKDYGFTWIPEPVHLMMNGKWLMHCDGRYLHKKDPNKPSNNDSYAAQNMIVCPKGKYIETFVSPNQYMK